jgi:hypothetical protein
MQEQGRQVARRLADAADLLIDFATLGEYGLEMPGEPMRAGCEARQRRTAPMPAKCTLWALATARG